MHKNPNQSINPIPFPSIDITSPLILFIPKYSFKPSCSLLHSGSQPLPTLNNNSIPYSHQFANTNMGLNSHQTIAHNLHWSQDIINPAGNYNQVKKQKQQQEQEKPGLACPRCESTNTKFCYFNNYSKSQPRHFCKACRRHWTNGGTLRNVPVGGGRKNKRGNKTTTRTGISKDETVVAAATGNVLVQNSQVLDGNGMVMGPPSSSSCSSSYLETFIDPFGGSSFFSEWSPMNGGFHWSAPGDDHDPVLSSSGFVVGPGVMMPPMFGGNL